jgi:hypothetical protein
VALADAVSSAVAAWALDEASGTRVDQVGSNDLTDNNTVGSGTGIFGGSAADFEADNDEYLSHADNADLSTGDITFMLRVWVKLESKRQYGSMVNKWTSGGNLEFELIYESGPDRFLFYVSSSGSNAQSVVANNFGAPSTGTWYLLHAWHNATTNEIGISVNGGTADTVSWSNGVFNSTETFYVGGFAGTVGWDGLMSDLVFLKGYALDATERTEDYNSGAGVAFADWDGGGGGGFQSAWAAMSNILIQPVGS